MYNGADFEPVVAAPYTPENVEPARSFRSIELDQCYIGSCTGGKISDFMAAARILKGNQVKVKSVIVPATTSALITFKLCPCQVVKLPGQGVKARIWRSISFAGRVQSMCPSSFLIILLKVACSWFCATGLILPAKYCGKVSFNSWAPVWASLSCKVPAFSFVSIAISLCARIGPWSIF